MENEKRRTLDENIGRRKSRFVSERFGRLKPIVAIVRSVESFKRSIADAEEVRVGEKEGKENEPHLVIGFPHAIRHDHVRPFSLRLS